MNDKPGRFVSDDFGTDDERIIDLLVDGELESSERRQLLERLDSTPDGWRRCALAFLETQAWRQAIASDVLGVATAPASAGVIAGVASAPNEKGRRERPHAVRSVLALAATFLVAFSLGFVVRSPTRPTEIVRIVREPPIAPPDRQPADRGDTANEPEPRKLASAGTATEQMEPESFKPVGLLTWSVEQNGTERHFAVPVVDGSAINEAWLHRQPSVVSDSLRRTLESKGHRIVEHRQFMNLSLEDGRRVVVPINEVEVQLASRVYQ